MVISPTCGCRVTITQDEPEREPRSMPFAEDDASRLGLRVGERVQVRMQEEILATLDANGRLDELPFMPEMLQYCGKTMRVSKRAHKTCDPAMGTAGLKMGNTVHLENIRCDGSAHDGCEAGCLIFWKEAWLKRIDGEAATVYEASSQTQGWSDRARCSADILWSSIRIPAAPGETEPTYVCQNTQIKFATKPQAWWDARQYVEDYTSGNVRIPQLFIAFLFFVWRGIVESRLGIGSALRWIYDKFQRSISGVPYPARQYGVPKGSKVPRELLDLQPGERVRVKPYKEILKTLDSNYRNRGLLFDPEMVPFTEREYVVARRVKQIIDEKTSKMVRFKTDAIILKDVTCEARYAMCRRFCPRAIYPYWREIWLERVPADETQRD